MGTRSPVGATVIVADWLALVVLIQLKAVANL
jgi:hypothetical protein